MSKQTTFLHCFTQLQTPIFKLPFCVAVSLIVEEGVCFPSLCCVHSCMRCASFQHGHLRSDLSQPRRARMSLEPGDQGTKHNRSSRFRTSNTSLHSHCLLSVPRQRYKEEQGSIGGPATYIWEMIGGGWTAIRLFCKIYCTQCVYRCYNCTHIRSWSLKKRSTCLMHWASVVQTSSRRLIV